MKRTPFSVAVLTDTVGKLRKSETNTLFPELSLQCSKHIVELVVHWTVFVRYCGLTCWWKSFGFLAFCLKHFSYRFGNRHLAGQEHGV